MSDSTKDIDILETQEWLEAFEDIVNREGVDRAKFIFEQLLTKGSELGIESSYASAAVKRLVGQKQVEDQAGPCPSHPGG